MTSGPLDYPQRVPVKVMGDNGEELRAALDRALARHVAPGTPVDITSRESRAGKYIAYTATFMAESREQLIAVYTELRRCEAVRFLL